MKKYALLMEILGCLEAYEQNQEKEGASGNLSDFLQWAYSEHNRQRPSAKAQDYQAPPLQAEHPALPLQGDVTAQITQLLVLMNKYLRYYIRKAFKDSTLGSPDDFGFLATLIFYGDMSKGELIERNTGELTSGMEVIKRLERAGLLRSFDDPKDRRSRRVAATDAGIEAFAQVLPAMQQIGDLAMADLNPQEREQLLELLLRLHRFHQPIFFQSKKSDWEQIAKFKD